MKIMTKKIITLCFSSSFRLSIYLNLYRWWTPCSKRSVFPPGGHTPCSASAAFPSICPGNKRAGVQIPQVALSPTTASTAAWSGNAGGSWRAFTASTACATWASACPRRPSGPSRPRTRWRSGQSATARWTRKAAARIVIARASAQSARPQGCFASATG